MDWRYYLLKKTGYSFYTRETSGKVLEFLGTSGVGKSTLFYNSVAKLPSRWMFAYHLGFLHRNAEPCEVDEILMAVLKSRIEKIMSSETFCPWHSLLDLQLSAKIMQQTMLIAHEAFSKGFAFHEGLFRHFAAEILEKGDEFPVQLWKNRAFVYLRSRNPDTVFSRYKSREAISSKSERQRIGTDDQVLSRIKREQQNFQAIVDKAPSFGCPVLVLDAENPLKDSIEKVLDFERTLSQKFRIQEETDANAQPLTLDR